MKNKILLSLLLLFTSLPIFAETGLRSDFQNNKAVICGINIRNFNSQDTNKNGFIDEGEIRGNFLNAIERLDEIKDLNVNALHLLPITPVGKLKALGTAGSLYAISDFTSINPQLADKNSDLTPFEQAKLFIEEAHKRGISIIVDLPSCGSYDYFLTNPELFLKDDKNLSIIPTDWTDVRLFNTGNSEKLNQDLLAIHKKFIDMVIELGVDGIRADVATIKPYNFWDEVIKYTRERNPEFLFLAEASDSWREPPSKYAQFTPFDKLLQAGFDGYYGSFFSFKDWKTSEDLFSHIKFNKKLFTNYVDKKNVILSFTTHDELSPILVHGEAFSVMIAWLEATLPFNPYFIDGFQYGDDYLYPLANSKALISETDDDYYFVHRGKLDIFNFSAKPGSLKKSEYVTKNVKNALQFRKKYENLISEGSFSPLKTDNEKVFAFSRTLDSTTVVVIGNLDRETSYKRLKIKIPELRQANIIEPVKNESYYRIKKNRLITDINKGEIKVLLMEDFSL